ncbi:MAG: PIN domain-containing protein [Oscillospiraceae bacterium]|jgi:predicted nucleic acid-binding protein|nr:PIN domain-containing protein [Oscillospiraceae bacterium]
MIYALDSDTISYVIKGTLNIDAHIQQTIESGGDIIIPPQTYFEILRGLKYRQAPKQTEAFMTMVRHFPVGVMSFEMWTLAAEIFAELRQRGITIDTGDILIAAFCIIRGYTLITNNLKHFQRIPQIKLENWTE